MTGMRAVKKEENMRMSCLAAGLAAGVFLFFGCSGEPGKSPAADYEWITIDEDYEPRDMIEEYIKTDTLRQGIAPVAIRNYGRNARVLKAFRGARFAGANPTVLSMTWPGLDDWMLVDIKHPHETGREIERTVLYVMVRGRWMVGDSGKIEF